jgi:hypothetical protein
MDLVNAHYQKALDTSKENFVNFVKINTHDLPKGDKEELEWLAQRIAMNMYYYPSNIETAKSDYISFIGLLIKHGLLFKKQKDLKMDKSYPY